METDCDLWVFAYGSLMWNPGFPFREQRGARLYGYHRSFCIYSHVYRGTPDKPGLVLGLDRGGLCRGLAFRVTQADAAATIAYLREREQPTKVYHERRLPLRLDDGRRVSALAYVVDRAHPQYAGRLEERDLLRLIRQGIGISGSNRDYVRATQEHLTEMGMKDRGLAKLSAALG